MNRTTTRQQPAKPLTVDINGLAGLLSCGHATARKIGEQAEARICIGRRVLYSVEKVQKYIYDLAD